MCSGAVDIGRMVTSAISGLRVIGGTISRGTGGNHQTQQPIYCQRVAIQYIYGRPDGDLSDLRFASQGRSICQRNDQQTSDSEAGERGDFRLARAWRIPFPEQLSAFTTLIPTPWTLKPKPETLDRKKQNPKPRTQNQKP